MSQIPVTEAARLSVAPMMDWTDRHCRYFHRQLSQKTLLYTEMVTAPALVRGDARHLLRFDSTEHPVALQLGGSDPDELAEAARMGEGEGYDEINLNVGCPSDKVQSGAFGAVLMKSPELVTQCCDAMRQAVSIPVTVKCRIGVDDQSPEEVLPDFLRRIQNVGISRIAIHARKAWLDGLSPKENRDIPPLDYALALSMKSEFPDLHVSVNGGIETLDAAEDHIASGFDGVMIGRAAYHDPWSVLGHADSRIFNVPTPNKTPQEAAHAMVPYIERHVAEGGRVHNVTRHMLGLFAGRPGARAWRRHLSVEGVKLGTGSDVVTNALAQMPNDIAA